jgi:methylated-DNA-[protein]-cysteine S-methyltransferase
MSALGYTLFDTAIGRCGLAWHECLITAVQLPELDDARTAARLLRAAPVGTLRAEPPVWVAQAMARVVAVLHGASDDLADLPLDMSGVPPFHQGVYAIARAIPPGRTMTYGEVAARLGQSGAARAVGQALGHNPFAPVVPCHRVLAAGQRSGGFSAKGGVNTKLRMLLMERAQFGAEPGLF